MLFCKTVFDINLVAFSYFSPYFESGPMHFVHFMVTAATKYRLSRDYLNVYSAICRNLFQESGYFLK